MIAILCLQNPFWIGLLKGCFLLRCMSAYRRFDFMRLFSQLVQKAHFGSIGCEDFPNCRSRPGRHRAAFSFSISIFAKPRVILELVRNCDVADPRQGVLSQSGLPTKTWRRRPRRVTPPGASIAQFGRAPRSRRQESQVLNLATPTSILR